VARCHLHVHLVHNTVQGRVMVLLVHVVLPSLALVGFSYHILVKVNGWFLLSMGPTCQSTAT
jgi:hypothetical protein